MSLSVEKTGLDSLKKLLTQQGKLSTSAVESAIDNLLMKQVKNIVGDSLELSDNLSPTPQDSPQTPQSTQNPSEPYNYSAPQDNNAIINSLTGWLRSMFGGQAPSQTQTDSQYNPYSPQSSQDAYSPGMPQDYSTGVENNEEKKTWTTSDPNINDSNGVYQKHASLLNNIQFDYNEDPGLSNEIENFKAHWEAHKHRYEAVAKEAGIPAELIAAIHYREAGTGANNFDRYLHNGQRLGTPTTIVPHNVFFGKDEWEEAAVEALKMKENIRQQVALTEDSRDLAAMATFAEYYNGLGYHYMNTPSTYVYSGTSAYEKGKYVSDGQYNPNVKDRQIGIIAMLQAITV